MAYISSSARVLHLGLEEAVEVDDHVLHLGIVNRALGVGAPGVLGVGVGVEDTDDVDGFEVDEVEALGVGAAGAAALGDRAMAALCR